MREGEYMGDIVFSADSCVVLTTPERVNYFSSVLGEEIDLRFDPEATNPLADFLVNVFLSGGKTVILDEAHFYTAGHMLEGIDRYLDEKELKIGTLRLVVVCSRRRSDDPVLLHLASYCGLYDLIWDVSGTDLSVRLSSLLCCPNSRKDVLEILSYAKVCSCR